MMVSLRDHYPISRLCEVLDLPRSSAYYGPKPDEDRSTLEALIKVAGEWPTYGYRRLTKQLQREGHIVNSKLVRKLMHELGIAGKAPERKPRTTDSGHAYPRYPNLVEGLEVTRPDEVWVAEIVHSQMTKPAGLAGRPDRERITDLDVVPGHHDPVDQHLDQLPPPLERRRVETHPHSFGEPPGGVRRLTQLLCPARFSRE